MREKVLEYLERGILLSPDMVEEKLEIPPKTYTTQESRDKKTPTPPSKNITGQKVEIVKNYEEENSKKALGDFVNLYNNRYMMIQEMLRQRREMGNALSIAKCNTLREGDQVSLIGMVLEKSITKKDNIMLMLEDQTGMIKAVVTKNNKETHRIAKDLTTDEVIGITGSKGTGIVFINAIYQPDVPLTKELKKSPLDEAAVFISDIHVGSEVFLKTEFERFISWIRGEAADEKQRQLTKKIKYLFIIGDLVEGIGIFPGQEEELVVKDIYEQYDLFCKYINKIPDDINIIICPGNHDPVRIAEPQPRIPEALLEGIKNKKNIFLVSSPSMVRISLLESFKGIDVLLYHGFSFPHYASDIETLRLAGGLEATENIMEYLLKRRHLAPTHGSTQYQLGYEGDPLAIDIVPDIFATGHVHRAAIKNYKNVSMLNCSCWISQTKYQERRGIMPQPARATYIDLKTRKTTMINFMGK